MTSFAALMALSATQTRQSEAVVQSALAEKQRRDAQKRREQEDKERKEREMESKMRLKRFEEEKREQERLARFEREREAREREQKRREEEERARLLHGPKKAGRTDSNGYPVSRAGGRKGRSGSDDSDDGANALTREEKRKRRMELEMRHGTSGGRRANSSNGYSKAGRRLPGGAVDITTSNNGSAPADGKSTMSVRQRLAQAPTLIKLNVNKRDTRTIDEILQDRAKAKAKTLEGEEAKEFKDWFGKAKETKAFSQVNSTSTSRANTPAGGSQKTGLQRTQSGSASPASKTLSQPRPSPSAPIPKSSSVQRPATSRLLPTKSVPSTGSKAPVPSGRATATTPAKLAASASKPIPKKRPRSPSTSSSRSPSPPPAKRRGTSSGNDISSEIWKLFGKDRSRYVAADVMSDDEDMEAGASDLEREELRSMRIARKEDELAMEEERRHEEEKRRRKRKEKEVRDRRE